MKITPVKLPFQQAVTVVAMFEISNTVLVMIDVMFTLLLTYAYMGYTLVYTLLIF